MIVIHRGDLFESSIGGQWEIANIFLRKNLVTLVWFTQITLKKLGGEPKTEELSWEKFSELLETGALKLIKAYG